MARFDRFDICDAYYLLEMHWHEGGWLRDRPSNVRRGQARGYVGEATHVQLNRIGYVPSLILSWASLSDNARDIYIDAARRFGLPISHLHDRCSRYVEGDDLEEHYPTCPECGQ